MPSIIPLVFVCPPPGKPDPALPPPPAGEPDRRPRVLQKASQDKHCWHYAYHMLRVRQGYHHAVQATPERQLERAVSMMRREVGALERSLPGLCAQLGEPKIREALTQIDKRKTQWLAAKAPLMLSALEGADRLALQSFLEHGSSPTFYDHLMHEKFGRRAQIQEHFLRACGIDPAALFPQSSHASSYDLGTSYGALADAGKAAYLGSLIREHCERQWHLTPVPWTPRDPAHKLAALLEAHGPLAVSGALGRDGYVRAPIRAQEPVAGRTVFGWAGATARPHNAWVGHVVVVVGCEQRAQMKPRVYFVDPDDASGPPPCAARRIYTLSYEAFIARCCAANGVLDPDPDPGLVYLLAGPPEMAAIAERAPAQEAAACP